MNNPREFQPPTNNLEIPQEKNDKIPQNLTPSHKQKLLSCLQLQSTTLLWIRAHYKARETDVQDLWRKCTYLSRSLEPVWHSPGLKAASLLEPGQSRFIQQHWPLVLTQILTTTKNTTQKQQPGPKHQQTVQKWKKRPTTKMHNNPPQEQKPTRQILGNKQQPNNNHAQCHKGPDSTATATQTHQ